jgi:hypothetical protein
MNLANFIAGLQLLSNHFEKRDGYHIGAEHDQFYVYQTDRPLSPEDVARLYALDWFQEGKSEEGPASYDPGEGWTCFV